MNDGLHFIGIGGIGMSALARIALARRIPVSGSNDKESDTTRRLRDEGARIAIGHRPENISGRPCVVVTSAVAPENPELRAAQNAGCRILRRGALLAELFNGTLGVAVAGTHGKTTVTGMIAGVFEAAGLDPTVAVGGLRRESGTNFRCGTSDWFITESDESDGSFVELHPHIGIVLNIENDHITSDDGMAVLREQFRSFTGGIAPGGRALLCVDDAEVRNLIEHISVPVTGFGFTEAAQLRGVDITMRGLGSRCTILENGIELGVLRLGVPGKINVANALAAVAAGRAAGIPFGVIALALGNFGGVRRRFDILFDSPRCVVVDDYAHHPTAVEATIAAARQAHSGPIIAVFQAHRYTRTAYLGADFARSLEGADAVVLPEIYAASESPIAGVDERIIGEPLRQKNRAVAYVARRDLVAHLRDHAPEGAMILMLGAGDITAAAHELAHQLHEHAAAGDGLLAGNDALSGVRT